MALIYRLALKCHAKVPDAAGVQEHEGGQLMDGEKCVGYYDTIRRTSCGTQALDTAAVSMTLFFAGTPVQSMTLHGARRPGNPSADFGSVSAASAGFQAHVGKPFERLGNRLTIV